MVKDKLKNTSILAMVYSEFYLLERGYTSDLGYRGKMSSLTLRWLPEKWWRAHDDFAGACVSNSTKRRDAAKFSTLCGAERGRSRSAVLFFFQDWIGLNLMLIFSHCHHKRRFPATTPSTFVGGRYSTYLYTPACRHSIFSFFFRFFLNVKILNRKPLRKSICCTALNYRPTKRMHCFWSEWKEKRQKTLTNRLTFERCHQFVPIWQLIDP